MKATTKLMLAAAAISIFAVPASAQMRRNIRVVGSSTVYPFAKAVAERFARANPGIPSPIVESTGTGAGLKLFCGGIGARFPDIANASRRIKLSEFRQCAANGVTQITEIQVGLDGLSMATGKGSDLRGVTTRDIYIALAKTPYGKPNTARTWKDVNGKLPALQIRVYGPPSTSGTRSSIEDLILIPACEASAAMLAMKKANETKYNQICKTIRTDGAYIEGGENDNLIVQKLIANPGTAGLFGYSYLEENTNRLSGVAINGVAPSAATISSFRYPGARALYIYVKNAHLKAIPGIRQYAAEFAKEGTFGPRGYLGQYGLLPSPDGARKRAAAFATSMTPMNAAGLK